MPTVEELEARLSAVEGKLAAQRRQALRESLTCPGCGNTEIFHISELEAYGLPVRVSHEGVLSIKALGVLELYLCSRCGYGEVQVDPRRLRDRAHVEVISQPSPPPREEDPYR